MLSRRKLLAASAAGIAAATSEIRAADGGKVSLKEGDVILFQGDSITDAGRDRNSEGKANDSKMLGRGYPSPIAGGLLADHPKLGLQIYNRGISGNKDPDLDARWDKDALDLKPAVLSILIGVNDIWHKLNGKYDGTPEVYRDGFTALLKRTKDALPKVQLVICEPFVLRCGAVKDNWFPEMEERRAFAEEVAKNAGAIWVPFQKMFDAAVAAGTEPAYWAADGVHPTQAGHALMAQTWRETTGI
jgi:lysophospholipase L1-like esterase